MHESDIGFFAPEYQEILGKNYSLKSIKYVETVFM